MASNKQILFTTLQFLHSLKAQKDTSIVDPDSFDIALQCLTEATGLSVDNEEQKAQLGSSRSLREIFDAGLSTASKPVESELEQFQKFTSMLKERGFFSGVQEGSPEYAARVETAKKKFEEKYGSTASSSSSSSTASNAPQQAGITEAQKKQAEEYKTEGNALLQQEKYDSAVSKYSAAIQLNPNNAIYYANRAAAYSHSRQYEKAIDDCRSSLKIDPNYAKAHYRLASGLYQLGKVADSIPSYETALKLSANDPAMSATISEQLATARQRLNGPAPGAGMGGMGGMGGLDFSQLLNNPAIQNMMSNPAMQSMLGNMNIAEMMNNPAIQQMANQFLGGVNPAAAAAAPAAAATSPPGGAAPASSTPPPAAGSGPYAHLLNHPSVAAMRSDPVMAPVLADVEQNGPNSFMKYMNDPNVMSKLSALMGPLMGNMGGMQ